ncbi:MAG TPA: hypothetical protein DEW46_05645, partial [Verrucomicrobia bacterium]|nr:hypothetical protein [Verrucomicrobiota bacterium]
SGVGSWAGAAAAARISSKLCGARGLCPQIQGRIARQITAAKAIGQCREMNRHSYAWRGA